MTTGSWVPGTDQSPFGLDNLPYGVFSPGAAETTGAGGTTGAAETAAPRPGVAIGDHVLDLAGITAAGLLDGLPTGPPAARPDWFRRPDLGPFLAAGRPAWRAVRARLTALLGAPGVHTEDLVRPHLVPLRQARLRLPWQVADYVDFYSSLHHAENLGRILRPGTEPLTPNWRHLPIGYHGRAGTVAVSGTPVVRPHGQRRPPGAAAPEFGPSARLDIEAEVGFVVGTGSTLGTPVPATAFAEHVFGVVLVNDWSARDVQGWEYMPLGPFLGKSFLTSVSPWIVPLDALAAARVPPPRQEPAPLPYLRGGEPWGLDLALEVRLNGHLVSRPPFAGMYWTPDQQLAHLTANGASLRTGDLYASGTVSGPEPDQRGSLIELSWNGTEPLRLPDGTTRTFLADGDTVTITATAPGTGGGRIGFGEVTGTVRPR